MEQIDNFDFELDPEVTTIKEFSMFYGEYGYYAAYIKRGDTFEVFTQVNDGNPTLTEFELKEEEAAKFFDSFVKTAIKTI